MGGRASSCSVLPCSGLQCRQLFCQHDPYMLLLVRMASMDLTVRDLHTAELPRGW